MRAGCPGVLSDDGQPGDYSYLAVDTSPDGGRFDCEDMRAGCPGVLSDDGQPGDYSYLAVDTSPDGGRK